MTTDTSDIDSGCPSWKPEIRKVLGLSADDPDRVEWERHADSCPECRNVLQNEREFQRSYGSLLDPPPVFISAAVMNKVRRARDRAFRLRPGHLAWGMAGSLAGIVLGVYLAAWNLPQNSIAFDDEPSYAEIISEMDDGIDVLIRELSTSPEGDQQ